MKRLLSLSACLFLLASCGGSSEAPVACESLFWNEEVGTCLPAGWTLMSQDELTSLPGEVIAAFRSEAPFSGQFPTVVVTSETLSQQLTSAEYSRASIASVKTLPGYELIDEQAVTIDGEEVSIHIYSAQPESAKPRARFYQVSVVSGLKGYTFTGAVPLGVSDRVNDESMLILSNVSFVEPQK